jgi:geranylgeranylglycerol-phosphate geranylgeranyltransferase
MYFSFVLFFLPFTTSFQLHFNKIPNHPLQTIKQNIDFSTKVMHFKKLIRSESILPTSLLCFTGGFIMNPSIIGLFKTPSFLISTINTILVMSSSMIVNDIFDIELDKVDHSDRPLVNGDISRKEAIGYLFGLLSIVEFLNVRFLPDNLQTIFHLAVVNIFLYTPIYKKIPFIKNIFCAAIVSFSVFVSGLSATKELMVVNPGFSILSRFSILSIALSIFFLGSWYSEILLDITDYDGDKTNKIYTVPVLYGKENAWKLASFLLYFNILSNTLSLSYLFSKSIGMVLPLILIPMVYDCLSISRESFSSKSVKTVVKNTRIPLFLLVIYLCALSLFRSGFVLNLPRLLNHDTNWLHIATTVFI